MKLGQFAFFPGIIWKFQLKFVSLQRERRSQVEPRCAERWHLCDDEQFDLAAWFPSLKYRAGHVWPAFSYLDIAFSVELLLICPTGGGNEVDKFDHLTTHLHLIVRMNDLFRQSVSIDEALAIVVEVHLKAVLGKANQIYIVHHQTFVFL